MAGGVGERGVESLRRLGLHADVVQTWAVVAKKFTIDVLPADRCDQLQLHVPEIAQGNPRHEIRRRAAKGAAVRPEVHVRDPYPLADA
ncbi:hypothetical protein A5636_15525 [Mycobacterium asiaticum]|uniref:Uncharacterized protein n=1 Tax=Mycobacterium asiaticum TaxID=1790 RepID=A0A1A3MQB2_MYCAS|nr:hypothetical protein A5636_15525 [Mycobacterium asiaticum]